MTCSIEGCERRVLARGWCNMHYLRDRRRSDLGASVQIRGDDDRRLLSKIGVTLGGCWPWQGKPDPDGYGRIKMNGGMRLAHRVVYEHVVGSIPEGHDLHHTCENKICVKPAQLPPLTPEEHRALHNRKVA